MGNSGLVIFVNRAVFAAGRGPGGTSRYAAEKFIGNLFGGHWRA